MLRLNLWSALKILSALLVGITTVSCSTGRRNIEARMEEALQQYKNGNYIASIEGYEAVLKKQNDLINAHDNLCLIKQKVGDFEGALENCNQVLILTENAPELTTDELRNRRSKYFGNKCNALLNLGDNKAAVKECSRAIQLNPKDSWSHYSNRCLAKVREGDYAEAINDCSNSIKIKSDNPYAFNNRCLSKIESGDLNGAVPDCETAIRLDPTLAYPYNNLGTASGKRMDFKQAIKYYDKAIQLDESNAQFYENRGNTKEYAGDIASACLDWQKSYQLGNQAAKKYIDAQCLRR